MLDRLQHNVMIVPETESAWYCSELSRVYTESSRIFTEPTGVITELTGVSPEPTLTDTQTDGSALNDSESAGSELKALLPCYYPCYSLTAPPPPQKYFPPQRSCPYFRLRSSRLPVLLSRPGLPCLLIHNPRLLLPVRWHPLHVEQWLA